MSNDHHIAGQPGESAWEAFALAVMVRASLMRAGGDNAAGISLVGEEQEAVIIGLDRLVEPARSIALQGAGGTATA